MEFIAQLNSRWEFVGEEGVEGKAMIVRGLWLGRSMRLLTLDSVIFCAPTGGGRLPEAKTRFQAPDNLTRGPLSNGEHRGIVPESSGMHARGNDNVPVVESVVDRCELASRQLIMEGRLSQSTRHRESAVVS
jgi:hypothetical protein